MLGLVPLVVQSECLDEIDLDAIVLKKVLFHHPLITLSGDEFAAAKRCGRLGLGQSMSLRKPFGWTCDWK